MKKILTIICIAAMTFGCEIEEQVNPNAPAVEDIVSGASETDLNNLVTGVLARMRNGMAIYTTASGTIARELYLFDADPRNTTDLIGSEGPLDNDSFYTTSNWINRYRTIKNCNILLESLPNAENSVSSAEKSGYSGFAKTMMAHQFLIIYSAYFDSGIRLDVADPNDYGALEDDPAVVLDHIRDLLDEAATELSGAEFAFTLTSGFVGFDTPASFTEFNRALAARAALYDGDMTAVLTHLDDSFMDLNGALDLGPKMIFSTSGGDLLNDLYKVPQQNGNQIVVSDTWIADAEAGDLRVANKAALRETPTSKSGISAAYETRLYASATSPIDIIRNEELILMYAEANIGVNDIAATDALNVIRDAADLPDKVGAIDITDVLFERRYSLWGEAHRMIDLRRTGRLDEDFVELDPIVVDGEPAEQIIFEKFPLPLDEVGN